MRQTATGAYEELNVLGTPTGMVHRAHEGEPLPRAPRGFTWRRVLRQTTANDPSETQRDNVLDRPAEAERARAALTQSAPSIGYFGCCQLWSELWYGRSCAQAAEPSSVMLTRLIAACARAPRETPGADDMIIRVTVA